MAGSTATMAGTAAGETPAAAFRDAVADDLRMLAALHDRELEAADLDHLVENRFPEALGLVPRSERARAATGAMAAARDALPRPLGETRRHTLAADYAGIYLSHRFKAPPTESPWFDDDGLDCQEPMFQVRAAYRHHNLAAADWRTRPDDHMVLQLQFVATLVTQWDGTDDAPLRDAARFLDEHLLRWIGAFSTVVGERADTAFYRALAALTHAYVEDLRDLLAGLADEPRPDPREIRRRMKPRRGLAREDQGPTCGDPPPAG